MYIKYCGEFWRSSKKYPVVILGLNFYFICTIQIHQKGNTEFIGGIHYTNGIQKKVSRLIRICIPFCTIIYMYSILRNCHNNYKTVCILHVNKLTRKRNASSMVSLYQ